MLQTLAIHERSHVITGTSLKGFYLTPPTECHTRTLADRTHQGRCGCWLTSVSRTGRGGLFLLLSFLGARHGAHTQEAFTPLSPSSEMSCPQQLLRLPSLLFTFLLAPDRPVQWPQSPLHLQGGLPLWARLLSQWAAVCAQEPVWLHGRLRQLLPREWGQGVGVGTPQG